MTTAAIPNITLDLRGLQNPESILQLAGAATTWRRGDTVQVVADDECFANDFLRWCVGCDLEVVSLRYRPNGDTELMLRVPRGTLGMTA